MAELLAVSGAEGSWEHQCDRSGCSVFGTRVRSPANALSDKMQTRD
jgi:hypothetical protein